ncbi:MAG TPA: acyltransferase, partial [Mucilaginibacter sp.]
MLFSAFKNTLTIRDLDSGRNNNFDLLRFVAALMVIFSHSFLVTNTYFTGPYTSWITYLDFGGRGVKIFFSISGYLITKSLFRQPTLASYVWARCVRILPALFVAALFCAFIIGPICTSLPLSQYFANPEVYRYLYRFVTLHNYMDSLPGTFMKNSYPGSVNSPIWTLPAELLMYFCVLL